MPNNLRDAIIKTNLPWQVTDSQTNMKMVLIPGGEFLMGCTPSTANACGADENPPHTVTLTNSFYMGQYEVTQAQWHALMGSNPSAFQNASPDVPQNQVPNRPVETVSWNMVQGFLNATTGMRLPTEAEWEYAYRAGTTTAFHGYTGQTNGTNDDTMLGNIAWYASNSDSQTRPVGCKSGNGFGLYDMSGNVWEWVSDWYGNYPSSSQTNPSGPSTGSLRVFRGGSWDNNSYYCRASFRSGTDPGITHNNIGFRTVRAP